MSLCDLLKEVKTENVLPKIIEEDEVMAVEEFKVEANLNDNQVEQNDQGEHYISEDTNRTTNNHSF